MLFKKTCLSAAIGSLALFSATQLHSETEVSFQIYSMSFDATGGKAVAFTPKEMCNFPSSNMQQPMDACGTFNSEALLYRVDETKSNWATNLLTPDEILDGNKSIHYVGYMSLRDAQQIKGSETIKLPDENLSYQERYNSKTLTKAHYDQMGSSFVSIEPEKPVLANVQVYVEEMPKSLSSETDEKAGCSGNYVEYFSKESDYEINVPEDYREERFHIQEKDFKAPPGCSVRVAILNARSDSRLNGSAYNVGPTMSVSYVIGFGGQLTESPYAELLVNRNYQ